MNQPLEIRSVPVTPIELEEKTGSYDPRLLLAVAKDSAVLEALGYSTETIDEVGNLALRLGTNLVYRLNRTPAKPMSWRARLRAILRLS